MWKSGATIASILIVLFMLILLVHARVAASDVVVINVAAARHLDSDRKPLSLISDEVKYLDGFWSGVIPSGHFVRLTFEQQLTPMNDITLYPRVKSGAPSIIVYEKDDRTPNSSPITFFNAVLDNILQQCLPIS